jgi:hypothetical protein
VMFLRSGPPKMTKGDIIEVDLPSGHFAYIQDLGPGRGSRLVRFLPGTFGTPLRGDRLESLVRGGSLYRSHCFVELLLVEDGARIIANLPIPVGEGSMPPMVTMSSPRDWRRWWVTDENGVKLRAQEYLDLHPGTEIDHIVKSNDMPGPKELRARIEAAWSPTNQVEVQVDDTAPPSSERFHQITHPRTTYFMYFKSREAATVFIESTEEENLEFTLADHDQDGLWEVTAALDGYATRPLAKRLRSATEDMGGIFDGSIDISK